MKNNNIYIIKSSSILGDNTNIILHPFAYFDKNKAQIQADIINKQRAKYDKFRDIKEYCYVASYEIKTDKVD